MSDSYRLLTAPSIETGSGSGPFEYVRGGVHVARRRRFACWDGPSSNASILDAVASISIRSVKSRHATGRKTTSSRDRPRSGARGSTGFARKAASPSVDEPKRPSDIARRVTSSAETPLIAGRKFHV